MAFIYCKTTGYFDNRLPIPKGIIRYGLYGEAKTRNGPLKPIRRMPNAASDVCVIDGYSSATKMQSFVESSLSQKVREASAIKLN